MLNIRSSGWSGALGLVTSATSATMLALFVATVGGRQGQKEAGRVLHLGSTRQKAKC